MRSQVTGKGPPVDAAKASRAADQSRPGIRIAPAWKTTPSSPAAMLAAISTSEGFVPARKAATPGSEEVEILAGQREAADVQAGDGGWDGALELFACGQRPGRLGGRRLWGCGRADGAGQE